MRPKNVWVVHHNCTRSCAHCFCHPLGRAEVSATGELTRQLEAHGLDYQLYATNQMDSRLGDLGDKVNQGILLAGHHVDYEMVERRADAELVTFSLHGVDAATHELLAPSGDFAATVASIEELRRRRPDRGVEVYCVVHRKNHAQLERYCELLCSLGVSNAQFIKLSYSGRARELPAGYFMEQEHIVRFLETFHRIKYRHAPLTMNLVDNFGPQYSRFRQLLFKLFARFVDRYRCDCGHESIAIRSGTNEVYPCRYVMTSPELRMGHFDPERGLVITRNWFDKLEQRIGEPCRSCDVFSSCHGSCRAEAIHEKLRTQGVIDLYAGFVNCPVALGISDLVDARADATEIWSALKSRLPSVASAS